ncbi:MAG: FecR family protein [Pseudobacter sp.]|uniref:FecR family protein n=1 Tax=Pseudobacter sp. TaxID=2045420 RepID=UPI003F7EEA69
MSFEAIVDRIAELVQKIRKQEITPEETMELEQYEKKYAGLKEHIEKKLLDPDYLEKGISVKEAINTAEEYKRFLSLSGQEEKKSGVFVMLKRMAAAAVLVTLLVCAYLFFFNTKHEKLAKKDNSSQIADTILYPPTGNKALLILASGEQLILDTAKNGVVAMQGSSAITKTADELVYKGSGANEEVMINEISIPNGSNYKLVLADGTKIWLNSATRLKFPNRFTGKERKIELSGEAFIDVVKNQEQPFIVSANGVDIKVLGTSFNVNTYSDNPSINTTTLVEGAVQVSKNGQATLLKPGQQANVSEEGKITTVSNADTYAVTSWVRNKFYFENMPLSQAIQILARWYDFKVVYETDLKGKRVTAMMTRSNTANSVFQAIEESCDVDIEVSGKEVIIKKK